MIHSSVIKKELNQKGVNIFANLDNWIDWASPENSSPTIDQDSRERFFHDQHQEDNDDSISEDFLFGSGMKHVQGLSPLKDFDKLKLIMCHQLERIIALLKFANVANPLSNIYLETVRKNLQRSSGFFVTNFEKLFEVLASTRSIYQFSVMEILSSHNVSVHSHLKRKDGVIM